MATFPSPTAGWISNRNLATPQDGSAQGAEVLDNFFPTAIGAVLRRGSLLHATVGDGTQIIRSMFTYSNGATKRMFAASDDAIYDVSVQGFVPTVMMSGSASGNWIVEQFATAGGVFLIGVNGASGGFVYDGSTFSPLAVTFSGGLTTADMSHIWTYKQRLYFIRKESLDVWYLPVDSIAGGATKLPLAGVFPRGGYLVMGQTWSLDAGAAGGLSEQCIMVTSEGEVCVFQGLWPEDATWQKTGIYRIGNPLGPNAWVRAGGDLAIATTIGMVPLSQAIQRDVAALSPAAVSYPIEVAWNDASRRRGYGWHCALWAEGQMMLVSPAIGIDGDLPEVFAANARTGAWGRFTGWDVRCLCAFNGACFFGSTGGRVIQAYETGLDGDLPYTGTYVPLFQDMGDPASLKIARMVRHTMRAPVDIHQTATCQFDFDLGLPPAPMSSPMWESNRWNVGLWDESIWDVPANATTNQKWLAVGGAGYAAAPSLQVTSGSVAPLDAEIVRTELVYEVAQIVT